MLGYINYKIDAENEIIYFVYHRTITIEIIIKSIEEVIKDPNYSVTYDTLVDMQSCNLKVNLNELSLVANYLEIDPKLNAKRNSIYLTNKPNEVVITTLYSKLLKNTKITTHIISTIEAAQALLANNIEVAQIEKNLSSLQ